MLLSSQSEKTSRRASLKQQIVAIIKTVYDQLMSQTEGVQPQPEVLLLQYGSAFFEADDTDESDFDILLVAKFDEMSKYMEKVTGAATSDIADIRNKFFFGAFFTLIGKQSGVEAYAADLARIPQIKLILEDALYIDLSFAVVSNSEFSRNVLLGNSVVAQLNPLDSCTMLELQAVSCCEVIKDYVLQFVSDFSQFSNFLRNVKLWAQSRQIYGQKYCFLGGISWAILCAYVCSKFPLPALQDEQQV